MNGRNFKTFFSNKEKKRWQKKKNVTFFPKKKRRSWGWINMDLESQVIHAMATIVHQPLIQKKKYFLFSWTSHKCSGECIFLSIPSGGDIFVCQSSHNLHVCSSPHCEAANNATFCPLTQKIHSREKKEQKKKTKSWFAMGDESSDAMGDHTEGGGSESSFDFRHRSLKDEYGIGSGSDRQISGRRRDFTRFSSRLPTKKKNPVMMDDD